MREVITQDQMLQKSKEHAAPIEFDTTNNVAVLTLGRWVYVAPLAPVEVSS